MAELAKYRRSEKDELNGLGPARVPAQAVPASSSILPSTREAGVAAGQGAAAAGQFAGRGLQQIGGFVARGSRQLNEMSAIPTRAVAGAAANFASGLREGLGLAPIEVPSFRGAQAASPPLEPMAAHSSSANTDTVVTLPNGARLRADQISPFVVEGDIRGGNFRLGQNPEWAKFNAPDLRSTPIPSAGDVRSSAVRPSAATSAPAAAAPAESGFTSKFSEEGLRLRSAAREAAGADASPEAFRAKVMELAGSDPTGNRVVNGVRMTSDRANNIAEALYRGPMTEDGTAATFDDSFRTASVDRSPTEAYKRNIYLEGPSRVEDGKRVRGDITVQQVDDTRVAAGPQETQVYNPRQSGGQGFRTQAEALSGVPVETALKSAQAANFEAEAATLPAFRGAQANKYNAEAASEGTRADAAMIAARAAETSAGAKATTDKWVQTEQTTGYDTFGAPVTSKVLINPTTGAKIDPTEYAPLAKRAYQALDTRRRQLVDDYLGDRDADPMDILAYIQSLGR